MADRSSSDSGLDIALLAATEPEERGAAGRSLGDRPDSASLGRSAPISNRSAPWGNYLRGDVLACRCPDCGYPMSVRMWLSMADCAECGLSIAVTEEWLRQNVAAPPVAKPVPQTLTTPIPPLPSNPVPHPPAKPVPPTQPVAPLTPATNPFPELVTRRGLDWGAITDTGATGYRRVKRSAFYDWLSSLPAWLLSFILHLLAMILLGLLAAPSEVEESIILSLRVGTEDRPGAEALTPIEQATEFEEPGDEKDEETPKEPENSPTPPPSVVADAESLTKEQVPPSNLQFSPVELVAAVSRLGDDRMAAGRDPRVRAAVVDKEGGTEFTEAAVTRGLFWLANHQNEDGSWSLHDFANSRYCQHQCNGGGHTESNTAATSLALLPFLGAGQTHLYGKYQGTVAHGLAWLVSQQLPDGDLRGSGNGRMYAHGQCTIVLCEALAMTKDKSLYEPCRRAVQFILDAQHEDGGWRYEPGEAGDTSVFGWQLMALQSAKQAGFRVPEASLRAAAYYLDEAQTDTVGGRYGYQPGHDFTPAMTAEAALCRQYLGWTPEHKGLRAAMNYCLRQNPPKRERPNIYYWYYATQFMHHMGGDGWRKWNLMMRSTLVEMQETTGHEAGSWSPDAFHDYESHAQDGGRIYTTSLAVCTLETYYRHLPLFRGVEVAEPETVSLPR